jgi:hypothetical protein
MASSLDQESRGFWGQYTDFEHFRVFLGGKMFKIGILPMFFVFLGTIFGEIFANFVPKMPI